MAVSAIITRILQNVRVRVPGALDTAIQLELFNALDELLSESNAWTNDLTVNVLGDGTLSYALTALDIPSYINRLIQIADANKNIITDGTMSTPGTLVFQNARSSNITYTVTVALSVSDPVDANNNPVAPDWVYSKYYAELQTGVIGGLLSQPAKPYTNERLGVYHTRLFQAGVATAKQEWLHKNVFRAQAWRFPGSFSVRRQGGSSILPVQ